MLKFQLDMEKSLKPDERFEIYFLANYRMTLGISLLALGAGILGIVLNLYQLIFGTSATPTTVIGTALALCLGSLLLLETKNSLLIISPRGIEYRRAGYTIFAEWKEVKKIEPRIRRRPEHVLILQKSKLKANCVNRFLLRLTHSDVIIPLNVFESNWPQKSIGKSIQNYAPQISLPS